MIGQTIGNYVVQKKVGEGGMGVVYLAEHPRIHRRVAIKVLLPQYAQNPQVVSRFFNEAKAANEIRNEHIVDILDFGELPDGAPYIIMEWLDGRSLGDVLDKAGKLPLARAVHIARGIARALSAAHAHGIVHRDLKPDNIFLLERTGDADFVKVLDFGIAKLVGSEQAASDVKTKTGALIGTPSYMSPEQCRGIAVDQRSDIYSLGVILYRMLTGRLPFEAEALGELLLQHMTQQPKSLREHEPTLPPSVDAAVLRALEKDPAKRPGHVDELMRQLADIKTGGYPILPEDAIKTALDNPRRRSSTLGGAAGEVGAGDGKRRGLFVAGGVALLAGFAATAVVVSRASKSDKPPLAVDGPKRPPVSTPPPDPTPSTTTPPTTPPTTTPATVLPTPAAPAEVRVTIKTQPPGAQLLLDDAPIANPFDGKFAKSDVKHRLTAKLSGFRTESDWITFDADRAIALTLTKGSDPVGTKKLPSPPPTTPDRPTTPGPTPTTSPKATEPTAPTGKDKTAPDKPDKGEKPVYKGTKGKLITEFPE
jgi:serine/threonine-protein kinase